MEIVGLGVWSRFRRGGGRFGGEGSEDGGIQGGEEVLSRDDLGGGTCQ